MAREKWKPPAGWVLAAKAELASRGIRAADLARSLHTTQRSISVLLNGHGGRGIADVVGQFLGIGPPYVPIESKEEGQAIALVKQIAREDPTRLHGLGLLLGRSGLGRAPPVGR